MYYVLNEKKRKEKSSSIHKSADLVWGWRVAYSDGSGAKGGTPDMLATQKTEGATRTVTRGHGYAPHSDTTLTTLNLSRGEPPRSGIEKEIKMALRWRQLNNLDTGIGWVRAHIGIKGNELADQHVTSHSYRGVRSLAPP